MSHGKIQMGIGRHSYVPSKRVNDTGVDLPLQGWDRLYAKPKPARSCLLHKGPVGTHRFQRKIRGRNVFRNQYIGLEFFGDPGVVGACPQALEPHYGEPELNAVVPPQAPTRAEAEGPKDVPEVSYSFCCLAKHNRHFGGLPLG